jgi:hypothetical protein
MYLLFSGNECYIYYYVLLICFFNIIIYYNYNRRLSFSPDGCLLVIPTGIHKQHLLSSSSSSSSSQTNKSNHPHNNKGGRSYCTHIFARDHWTTPCLSLIGLEEPSVAIRFCPRLFKLIKHTHTTSATVVGNNNNNNNNNNNKSTSLFQGHYR